MKKYSNNSEIFSQFNPEKYYAGKILDDVVDLQPIEYDSDFYSWNICNSTELNSYLKDDAGIPKSEIFTFSQNKNMEFYEFDTAKEKYKWISVNL